VIGTQQHGKGRAKAYKQAIPDGCGRVELHTRAKAGYHDRNADIELGDVGRGVFLVIRAAGEPDPSPADDHGARFRVQS
jgi:hypothetical protein